jgi:hypothetical protein
MSHAFSIMSHASSLGYYHHYIILHHDIRDQHALGQQAPMHAGT